MTQLGERFAQALSLANELHANQVRKGSPTPYIAHLLGVTALVLEHGGDEDMAIAALLHDAVEDQGGMQTLDLIRQKFGNRVAQIVLACSDAFELPKPPWQQRKDAYLAHLPDISRDARLVSLADKLHNARSILISLYQQGPQVWQRFNGGREGTLWYYQALLQVFQQTDQDLRMTHELAQTLLEIQELDHRLSTAVDQPY